MVMNGSKFGKYAVCNEIVQEPVLKWTPFTPGELGIMSYFKAQLMALKSFISI